MAASAGFIKALQETLSLELQPRQIEAFDWYASELVQWNRKFNLTAITDRPEIEIKHFLDSLTCLRAMRLSPEDQVVDVGTGAGFPGIPIKILFPAISLTLVESIGKKVDFCRHVVDSLNMDGVEIVHARVEQVGQDPTHRQRYNWALARAVASMAILVEYVLPLLCLGGKAVLQKGETGPAEVQAAEGAMRILGGHIYQVLPVVLPTVVEKRYLVVINKVAATPEKYPRRSGIPAKRPLTKIFHPPLGGRQGS
jgi:16S rRNA (guanine527-N7)-methyltransferase